MSLIACPECKAKVSTLAAACPTCGFPVYEQVGREIEADIALKNVTINISYEFKTNVKFIDRRDDTLFKELSAGLTSFQLEQYIPVRIEYLDQSLNTLLMYGKNYNLTMNKDSISFEAE